MSSDDVDAAEIRIRAERRIGELMAAQKDAGLMVDGGTGANQHKNKEQRVAEKPAAITLAEVGIDKNLADRARKYAEMITRGKATYRHDSRRTAIASRTQQGTLRARLRQQPSVRA